MNPRPTLDIAVSTYKPEGIERVEKMILPPIEGVRWVVSWQEHENAAIPLSLLSRNDISINRLNSKGLSNNRNNSIRCCRADIILISDDDMQYSVEGIKEIIKIFKLNPDIDLAIFKIDFSKKKSYPAADCELRLPLPKGYYASSVDLAFRRHKVADLSFNVNLGIGAPEMHCGEDEMFLFSAIKKGLRCCFFNILIGRHEGASTGSCVNPGILKGQGYVIQNYYPFTGWLRAIMKSIKINKTHGYPIHKSLRYLFTGILRALH